MDRPRWGLRNITGKMCKAFALEMKLDKLDEHPGFLWIFFRLPVATWVVFPPKKTSRESLEAFGFRGGLGVEGAAPSCRDLETELDQRRCW